MNVAPSRLVVVAESLWRQESRFTHRGATPRAVSAESEHHSLESGTVITVDRPLGRHIECLGGALWVTHDGDPKDVILEAGQRYRPVRNSRMLVQALGPAEFRVSRRAT